MTVAGPEPLDALANAPDREHYVDKQVRAVAEPVLAALGLDFDRVVGDDESVDAVLIHPRRGLSLGQRLGRDRVQAAFSIAVSPFHRTATASRSTAS